MLVQGNLHLGDLNVNLPVNGFAVVDFNDLNRQYFVFNCVDDTVNSHTDTVGSLRGG
jgi:hypothetical protein